MDLALAPQYWPQYSTGLLKSAISKLQGGVGLNAADVVLLRDYFQQWARAQVWEVEPADQPVACRRLAELRESAELIEDAEDVRNWVVLSRALGMDPL